MYVLIDLDGTLTNTASEVYKPLKDGKDTFNVEDIPLIEGAKEFVEKLEAAGHIPLIISDSHPRYVEPIARDLFQLKALSLADKPNTSKVKEFLQKNFSIRSFKEDCIVVGDTWLDIEMGRALNCRTVLTTFYKINSRDVRDGIGDLWRHLKSGPTYVMNSFDRILELISDDTRYLLACEAVFQDIKSKQSRKFKSDVRNGVITAFRSLGRQNSGEIDRFAIADKYYEFQREDRSSEVVRKLAEGVDNYIQFVVEETQGFDWDILTYVSDKATTVPANKMKELYELLVPIIPKQDIFKWKTTIEGSIRHQKHFKDRREFVNEYMYLDAEVDLEGKNVIVIDDQFTTGGTAFAITDLLRKRGVKNVLVVTMFYLITNVESDKHCPNCGNRMVVKIKRSDGTKFLSCTPPRFGGEGCGYILNF